MEYLNVAGIFDITEPLSQQLSKVSTMKNSLIDAFDILNIMRFHR